MPEKNRKGHRQTLAYRAHVEISIDREPIEVGLIDVSASGARIKIKEGEQIPDDFVLLLALPRGPRRKCRVVWRRESQLGIEFQIDKVQAKRSDRS